MIDYDPAVFAGLGIDENDMTVWYFNEGTSSWEELTVTVNPVSDQITVTLTHLSTFALAPSASSTETTGTTTETTGTDTETTDTDTSETTEDIVNPLAGIPGYDLGWMLGIIALSAVAIIIRKRK